jgi:hypothetical protein
MHTMFLIGKPEGKKLVGRPSHRWEGTITMDLAEIRLEMCRLVVS